MGASQSTACEVGTYNIFWHQADTNPNYPTIAPSNTSPNPNTLINLTDQDIFYDPNGVIQHVHCEYCRPGFYCDQIGMSDNIKPCPTGKFCTQGKFYKGKDIQDPTKDAWYTNPVSCLPGTYNPTPYATSISDCLNCPPGKYCAGKALDAPSGDCLAGYFCKYGSSLEMPYTNDPAPYFRWGYCPEGSYCPAGTAYPTPCPPGTFGAKSTLGALADCTPCTQGYYCPLAGMKSTDLATTTYKCEAGYYCPTGSRSPRPVQCSAGYYCPAGSATQIACPAGTYQNNVQQASCVTCPSGYYCLDAVGPQGAIAPTICPKGSVCVAGAASAVPCSLGYWMPEEGRETCFTCPTGSYCGSTGLNQPTAQCDAGYFCLTSSTTATPTISSQGGICTDGYYCPQGAVRMIPCEDGYFCTGTGKSVMDATNACDAGYMCYQGSNINRPIDLASQGGEICPAGFWCEANTPHTNPLFTAPAQTATNKLPNRCPPGTYNSLIGQTAVTACLPCDAGKYCESYATGYSYDKDGFDVKLAASIYMNRQ